MSFQIFVAFSDFNCLDYNLLLEHNQKFLIHCVYFSTQYVSALPVPCPSFAFVMMLLYRCACVNVFLGLDSASVFFYAGFTNICLKKLFYNDLILCIQMERNQLAKGRNTHQQKDRVAT